MKSKITDYVNRIEKLFEEVKAKGKEAEEIAIKAKESQGDLQDSYLMEHFVISNYAGLVYQDMSKTIDRLVECYLNALEMKVELNLTEEEQGIIDKYLSQNQFLFHIDKGKVVPKQTDLMTMMNTKAQSIKHPEFLNQYRKQVIK